MRTVVVFGGAGFVGKHLVAQLAARELRVVVPTRSRERAKRLILLPTVDVVDADVHDPATLGQLCSGAHAAVNLIGILHETRSMSFTGVHVEFAGKLIAACIANEVPRLVHMSALNASLAGPSSYLRSKAEAAKLVGESALQWTVFEPSVIFGSGDRFLTMFAQLQKWAPLVPLASANARFQPVFVGDVARAMAQSLFDDATLGQRYPLCGPKVYALKELVAYAGELAGHRRPILPLSPALANLQAAVLERLPGTLLTRDNLASMKLDSVCDCPFPAIFGFQPQALEAIAPGYLGALASLDRYAVYRAHHRDR